MYIEFAVFWNWFQFLSSVGDMSIPTAVGYFDWGAIAA
jgi:hypothetical protein